MKTLNKKILFLLAFGGIFIVASTVLALQVDWPLSPAGTKLTSQSQLPDLVKYLYEWGIALGGLAAFLALVMAGFQYLTSVGRPEVMAEAMDKIRSALFGLVLLLSSWLILNTINPQLTTFSVSFNPPQALPATTKTCQTDADCQKPLKCQGYYQGQLSACQGGTCYCFPDSESVACQSVKLSTETSEQTILPSDDCKNLTSSSYLSPKVTYSSVGYPKDCSGILYFYQRLGCETFVGSASANLENITVGTTVNSVRLIVPSETTREQTTPPLNGGTSPPYD